MTGLTQSIYAPPKAREPWRLEEILADSAIRYYGFGRSALFEALKLAGAGPGTSALFPEFFCREVLAPARALGAFTQFYPVNESLEPASDPADWPKTKAVVAVNYFGFPQDLRPFFEYAGRTGAVLIEDNAHGLFSRDEGARPLGARASLGIFSLRKTMALPNGAALTAAKNGPWILPAQLNRSWKPTARQHLKKHARQAASIIGWRPLARSLDILRKLKASKPGSARQDPDIERHMPSPYPCAELAQPLTSADPALEITRRQELYHLAENLAAATGVKSVFPRLPDHVSPYGYPFYADPDQLADVSRALWDHGLRCLPWPDLPAAVAARAPAHYRSLYLAHFLW